VAGRPPSDFAALEASLGGPVPRGAVPRLSGPAARESLAAPSPAPAAETGPRVKITLREPGLYSVGAAAIAQALGVRTERVVRLIGRGRLRLSNRGAVVAYKTLPNNEGILFYGEAIDTPYTRDNAYWLEEGTASFVRKLHRPPVKGSRPATFFVERAVAEENRIPVAHLFDDPAGDFWMWDYLFPGVVRDSLTVTAATPGLLADGPATLTVHLQGGYDSPAQLDHHAVILLNGTEVGETRWGGTVPHVFSVPIDAAMLADGDNAVEIRGILHTEDGVDASVFYLNRIVIDYPRRSTAVNDRLVFTRTAPANVLVDGFTSPKIRVWDITRPRHPRVVLGGAVSETAPDVFGISFHAGRRRYLLATGPSYPAPPLVEGKAAPSLAASPGADYVIVAGTGMSAEAERLAALRESGGLRAMVVDVGRIYDEFGHGLRDPMAINSFLGSAVRRWPTIPRYVVLAGKGSFDCNDYLGYGDCVIPPLLVPTPDGLFPSDVRLADVTGADGVPDLAIGRIPAGTPAQLADFVDKAVAFDGAAGAAWKDRATLAADEADSAGDFPADSEAVAGLFPDTFTLDRIYPGPVPPDKTSALVEAINEGRAFVNFIGHGNYLGLGMNDLLTVDGLSDLTNGERLPVLTGMTCLVGGFAIPGLTAFSEALVLRAGGGAIAAWSPSGYAFNDRSVLLDKAFYGALFTSGETVLGEAILRAMREYTAAGGSPWTLDIYNLLGDPAVVVR
jgi:hypothetical protein